jgi:ABC-type transporter Mla MlaB component
MIRIDVEDESKATTLHVEGKLAGDCVDELRRVWASVRNQSPEKETVVDLSSVRVVDCTGRKLLCQMHGWGTRLTGTGLMIGPLIEEICSEGSCSEAEMDC